MAEIMIRQSTLLGARSRSLLRELQALRGLIDSNDH